MEFSTCEEYVIAELEEAKDKIESLQEELEAAGRVILRLGELLYGYDKDWPKWFKGNQEGVSS